MKTNLPLAALLATAAAAHFAHAADSPIDPGLQLYSLRAQTLARGLTPSLDLVKSWGITEVEGWGILEGDGAAGRSGLSVPQVRAALEARGLSMPYCHVGYERLTQDSSAVIRDAKAVGAEFVICPWIPHQGNFDAAAMRNAADNFNRWGEAFRAAGLKFGYHTHGYEFVPGAAAGDTLLDDLIRACKPENVVFEMDVFWVVHGGGNPVELLEKYPTRWVALHVKDLRKGAPTGFTTGHAQAGDEVAVGDGQIDWPAVLGAAAKAGVRHFFVEDETIAPLKNIPASLAYLRTLKY